MPEEQPARRARRISFGFGTFVAAGAIAGVVATAIFLAYYTKYARLIDRQLAAGPFANTSNIYAAPEVIVPGDRFTIEALAAELKRSGYGASSAGRAGTFRVTRNALEIDPGPGAYLSPEGARVEFAKDRISRIVSLASGRALDRYTLEPQLIANISQNRERRRLVHYGDIPPVLVQAVLSAEDKRFFEHGGFDSLRMMKAAYVDFKEGRKEQGASTITMQLARSLWLDPAKNWRRKIAEMLITEHLERKLTKQQIFEDYANEVYLGRHGTYSIHGFGEAAREYFGKDIRSLTLPEAAMLAGVIQRPGYFDPFRNPDRARERRNLVLALMRQNGYITHAQYAAAAAAPVRLAAARDGFAAGGEAPFFMDLLSNELQTKFQDRDIAAENVYTTLDPDLQREAAEAVRIGMQKVDSALRKARRTKEGEPQVALVALDPHTGEIRALVGGRNYATSQLNRVLADRQPGSSFKPFVYAAALNTGLIGGRQVFTPATVIDDESTTFWFNNQPYQPADFKHEFFGQVTMRQALARSVNVATVKVAESVGYQNVAALAHAVGLRDVQATPSAALGSYDVTPLDLAGAYTALANNGVYVRPSLITEVRGRDGRIAYSRDPKERRVLDPRVVYLMVNMMQDVLRSGTAAAARSEGFTAPAAGKTGTSRDGWFAGFTSRLLCVVWVGFDDGHDLGIEGARSALPVWTEFMKRAMKYEPYAEAEKFKTPQGISYATIDPESGQLATPNCPTEVSEVFIAGTQPTEYCALHSSPFFAGAGALSADGPGTTP